MVVAHVHVHVRWCCVRARTHAHMHVRACACVHEHAGKCLIACAERNSSSALAVGVSSQKSSAAHVLSCVASAHSDAAVSVSRVRACVPMSHVTEHGDHPAHVPMMHSVCFVGDAVGDAVGREPSMMAAAVTVGTTRNMPFCTARASAIATDIAVGPEPSGSAAWTVSAATSAIRQSVSSNLDSGSPKARPSPAMNAARTCV